MKNLVLLAVMLITAMVQAQNIGQQFVTFIEDPDQGQIALVSENPHPGNILDEKVFYSEDTINVEVAKPWADQLILEPFEAVQGPILEEMYMISFSKEYYYICRHKECRWLPAIESEPEKDTDPYILRFQETADWPAFTLTFAQDIVWRDDLVKMLSTGEIYIRRYVYTEPNIWVY